jgi:uncharacterized membrane protein
MRMTFAGRHAPFYIAAISGLVVLPAALWLAPQLAIQVTANIFFLVYLALEFSKIRSLTPAFLEKHAASADEPVSVIFIVTFGTVVVAVGSLFVLLNGKPQPDFLETGLSLASVALGWLTIHTMAALHYAHLYWRPNSSTAKANKGAKQHGGLEFPGGGEPSGYDFLYFSLVTGMTAQTSDVAITSTGVRKLNLLHAVVSFFFNTVLVAAAVNVAVNFAN